MKNGNDGGYKDLYNKLKFAITFRVLAFSLIILAYVLLNFKNIIHYSIFIYIFTALIIFLSILYSALLLYSKKNRSYKFLVYSGFFQLSLDFFIISFIVIFNGGLNDKFIFLYYLLILTAGFIFLKLGVVIYGTASALAIGLSADLQYYFNIGNHYYFLYNPDRLLFLTSTNILVVLIFSWLFYRFSGELGILSNKIIEKEEFIKKSQNFNRKLFNSFSQGIIVVDDDSNIVFLNDAAVRTLNPNLEPDFKNKTGIPYNFDIKISDIFENFPAKGFEGKEKAENAAKRFELNHKNMILGFAVTGLAGNDRQIGSYILSFEDITYIKELELESRINEGLKTAGKFAGWLAHEIRNPLSAINTSVYVLDSSSADIKGDDYRRLINIIKYETGRLNNLVTDFLGFIKVKSKPGNGNLENFNLFRFTDESVLKYANGTPVKIHNSVDKMEQIFSEKARVGQVISNLIQNAIYSVELKLSKSGNKAKNTGIVRISAKKIKNAADKNFISLSVADNGEGMDEFTVKNACKPLFSTKENGFGLGLSIVYSIAESLGGEVSIISKKNVGTLIKINMPHQLPNA